MQAYNNLNMYLNALDAHSMFFVKDIHQNILPEKNFAAVCKALSRLEKENKVERVAKGIYCKPKVSSFGLGRIPFSERNIINYYLGPNQLFGILAGYSLFRKYGLTTQVEGSYIIYSNKSDVEVRTIRNVTVYRLRGEMSPEVKLSLEYFFIVHAMREIEDFNYCALIAYLEKTCKTLTSDSIEASLMLHSFGKRTIAQAKVILDYFGVENQLGRFLSPASVYNVLSMEEIYAIARQ